jgi:hypothetical protein
MLCALRLAFRLSGTQNDSGMSNGKDVQFVESRENVRRSLRRVLADSHVAAVAIALLLLGALNGAFWTLWDPSYRIGRFLFTAVAIWDVPYFSTKPTAIDRLMLISTFYFLYSALLSFLAAWLLSRWVYGVGPIRSLAVCCSELKGRKHA